MVPLLFGWDLVSSEPHGTKEATEHHLKGRCLARTAALKIAADNPNALAQLPEIHRVTSKQLDVSVGLDDGMQAAVDQLHQAAFASAIRSENGGGLPQVQSQVEILKNRLVPEPGFSVADIKPGFRTHGIQSLKDR